MKYAAAEKLEMHPLIASVLLRLDGLDSLGRNPELDPAYRESAKCSDSSEANVAPLSERIARGNPWSWNASSNSLRKCA